MFSRLGMSDAIVGYQCSSSLLRFYPRDAMLVWRRGVVVSGGRRRTKLTHVGPG